MATMIITNDEWCFLEIGIPTYNRSSKLNRLLSILEQETATILSDVKIRITVSDNHSTDSSQTMLQQHSFRNKIIVRNNAENVGALRNIWGLYETARADYFWFISDDDIPKSGSLKKIIDTLIHYKPTVLTFEFEQPPGNGPKRHGERTGIEELTDLHEAIPHILLLGKLTKQVIKTCQLKEALRSVYFSRDTGYGWLLVILEVIKLTSSPKVVVDHEFLASCDEDYKIITDGLSPQYWDDYLLLLDHEIVKANCSEYARQYGYAHPGYMVRMIYEVMAGIMKGVDKRIFIEKGRRLPFYMRYFRNPFVVMQWLSLRLELPGFPVICKLVDYLPMIKKRFSRWLKSV